MYKTCKLSTHAIFGLIFIMNASKRSTIQEKDQVQQSEHGKLDNDSSFNSYWVGWLSQ